MFSERLDEVIFVEDIAKFAESMKIHPHETLGRIQADIYQMVISK